jgi:hypothetical protein
MALPETEKAAQRVTAGDLHSALISDRLNTSRSVKSARGAGKPSGAEMTLERLPNRRGKVSFNFVPDGRAYHEPVVAVTLRPISGAA